MSPDDGYFYKIIREVDNLVIPMLYFTVDSLEKI